MRDIKFRAWDKMIKKMAYDNFSVSPKGQLSFYWQPEAFHSANSFLMQYVGLTDAHGVEIYEGDVLCWIHEDEEGIYESHHEVIFTDGMFGIYNGGAFYEISALAYRTAISGNVYENPELIKSPQKV